MSYGDFSGNRSELAVCISEVESRASGLAVGRLTVWPPMSAKGQNIIGLIEESGLDVVIVRAGAEDVELPAQLCSESLTSWQADTLLYFEIPAEELALGTSTLRLERLPPDSGSSTDGVIKRIFSNYKNHYSANPALGCIDPVNAYQEWVKSALTSGDQEVFQAVSTVGQVVGLCLIDTSAEDRSEILLAGVVPEERGHGAYGEMLRPVGRFARQEGKRSVVISTQAANIGALRAWCRIGFLPTIAVNTIHVVRRDLA